MAKSTGKKKTSATIDPAEDVGANVTAQPVNAVESISRFTDFDIHLFRQEQALQAL